MFYLFTYGTLMNNNINNYLLNSAKYVCDATIDGAFLATIENTNSYAYPALFFTDNENDEDNVVYGEVYSCPDDLLHTLDILEDEGILFDRIQTFCNVNGKLRKVILYTAGAFIKEIYDDGRLKRYTKKEKWKRDGFYD